MLIEEADRVLAAFDSTAQFLVLRSWSAAPTKKQFDTLRAAIADALTTECLKEESEIYS